MNSEEANYDIPLFLQHCTKRCGPMDLHISRLSSQDLHAKVPGIQEMEHWKMNLMAVSEKHRLAIFAIKSELHICELDLLTCRVLKLLKVVSLINDESPVNNLRLLRCAERDFIVTVDEAAYVRMVYLDNLDRDPIKFVNKHPGAPDNSTWSVDGNSNAPARVVVGSNAHAISVINLATNEI